MCFVVLAFFDSETRSVVSSIYADFHYFSCCRAIVFWIFADILSSSEYVYGADDDDRDAKSSWSYEGASHKLRGNWKGRHKSPRGDD
jgi:hypothetical protein